MFSFISKVSYLKTYRITNICVIDVIVSNAIITSCMTCKKTNFLEDLHTIHYVLRIKLKIQWEQNVQIHPNFNEWGVQFLTRIQKCSIKCVQTTNKDVLDVHICIVATICVLRKTTETLFLDIILLCSKSFSSSFYWKYSLD